MLTTTAGKAADIMGAKLVGGLPSAVVSGVSIDSRLAQSEHLFVAFAGEQVDGHDYLQQAIAKGATTVLISHPIADVLPANVAVLEAEDPLICLQRLAREERNQFSGPVIAVTGSNGKTTTKDMLRTVFSAHAPCLATEKNQNNELGLPLTLLKRESSHESIVVEMGMRARGEIRDLCKIAQPTTGIITNIGHSHLELLGSQENIALAKTELLDALPSDGTAVLHGDDPWLQKLAHLAKCSVLWYGFDEQFDAFATNLHSTGFQTTFTAHVLGETCHVVLPTLGSHNVLNALAALLAGAANGLRLQTMADALKEMASSSGRLHLVNTPSGRTVIDDCYNASPSSMRASLQVLRQTAGDRPKTAILGDMYELGSYAESGHREVGAFAVELGVEQVIAVGTLARSIADEARAAIENQRQAGGTAEKDKLVVSKVLHFEDKQELLNQLPDLIDRNAVVLVKASRGMKLEDIVHVLANA